LEGPDDQQLIFQLCNVWGLDNKSCFVAEPKEGKPNARAAFLVEAKFRGCGLIVDADESLDEIWQSVRDGLRRNGATAVPDAYPEQGFIEWLDHGRVGVFVLPGKGPGIAEDLLLQVAERSDPDLVGHARATVKGLAKPRFPQAREPKAVLHTWLAWQQEPGTRPGRAFVRGYLDPYAPEMSSLQRWLRAMFLTGAAEPR
jgi:hypothetical protein